MTKINHSIREKKTEKSRYVVSRYAVTCYSVTRLLTTTKGYSEMAYCVTQIVIDFPLLFCFVIERELSFQQLIGKFY